MKHSSARVVALDDQQEHLLLLASGLLMAGMQCTPVRVVNGDIPFDVPVRAGVRLAFLDLELIAGRISSVQTQNFTACVSILDKILSENNGPYFLVLWTMNPEFLDGFNKFINDPRREFNKKPVKVLALSKGEVGIGRDWQDDEQDQEAISDVAKKVAKEVQMMIEKHPSFAALLDWEGRVAEAATSTVNSLVETVAGSPPNLESLLANLGRAYAGKHHADAPFRSVNGAMLPLLFDAIENQAGEGDDIWKQVVTTSRDTPAPEVVAKFNTSLLVDLIPPIKGGCRGCVSLLDETWLRNKIGLVTGQLKDVFFNRNHKSPSSPEFRYLAIEISPACDFAQDKNRIKRFILGVDAPITCCENKKKEFESRICQAGEALWFSPVLSLPKWDETVSRQTRFIACNCLYLFSMTDEELQSAKPLYRLRDSLLDNLIHKVASHATRVGIVNL